MKRIHFTPLLLVVSLLASQWPAFAQASVKDRKKVVEQLAKSGGSTVIPELRGYWKDPEVEVRLEAVKAIVSIGTQHSLDALVEATADNDAEIQARATDGLVNFFYPGYVQTGFTASLRRVGSSIRGRFTDTNDQVIDQFIRVRPDIIEALGKLARGGNGMEVRANACRALGVLRGKDAISDMVEALRTKDSQVIYEVLIALQKIRDRDSAHHIFFLLRDMDEKVQITALQTTGLLQNTEALPQLTEALNRARDKDVRRAALTAIAMIPDESSRPIYERYLSDRDDQMRAAAAEGFARLRNPQDISRLEAAFEDEKKMNPRLSLAFALVMLGKNELAPFTPLQYLVNTLNSGGYRGVACPFLIELTRDKAVREKLYPGIHERTKDEKKELATIFARSGDKDSEPVLEALSRDGDTEVALEGTRALRILKARLP
ncbi:MAG: HEAT repeat domain-containing protein [Acidimicrobiia bacterium]|nr:HEAT repeat domain-containing protein [Acidimicrobiia bacterium]